MQPRQILRFGQFGFEPNTHILLKDGEPLRLTRKASETLLVLIQQSPNVVSKDDLLAAVWPDQIIDEHNLTQSISTARRALGVSAGQPGYIETFPGHGYRMLGPVILSQAPVPDVSSAPPAEPPTADHPVAAKETGTSAAAGPTEVLGRLLPWLAAALVIAMGAFAVFRVSARLRADHPVALRIVPLSRHGGLQYQPEVSPDGATVAFLWQRESTESPRIWLQNLRESTPRPLTENPGEYSSPAWSPDSRSIACLRFHENSAELVIIDVAGGVEHVVGQTLPTRFGLPHRHLDWSPDGQWIAVDDAPSLGSPLAIYLIDVKSGARTRITQPDDRIVGDMAPRFSPDGSAISFLRMPHRTAQDLMVVPRQGGAEVTVESTGHQISDQRWLSNPTTLAFASNRSGGQFRIWKTRPTPARSPRDVAATEVYGEYPLQFTVVPGQSSLVYCVLANHQAIWRLDLTERRPAERWKRLIESAGQDASPQYSPDGSRICFRSDRTGKEELWVAQADGSGAFPITSGPAAPSVPRWAPDSHSVVFNVADLEMLIASEQNGKWKVSSLHVQGVHPVFSPDGKWIYAGADNAILRYPAARGTPVPAVPVRGSSIDVSPDGETLYFVRQTSDVRLWSYHLATRKLNQVLDNLVPYCSSCWVATAKGVYYLGTEPGSLGRQAIFFHDFRTLSSSIIAPYPEPVMPLGIGPFSLSPDARYLLTVRVDPSTAGLLLAEPFR